MIRNCEISTEKRLAQALCNSRASCLGTSQEIGWRISLFHSYKSTLCP